MKRLLVVVFILVMFGSTAYAKDVVVMVYDRDSVSLSQSVFSEETPIFKSMDWFQDKKSSPTTLKKLYAEGWHIVGFTQIGGQATIILEKD